MRGAGERGQWADRITHTLDVEAPGEYTGRPTPASSSAETALRPPPLRLRLRHRAWAPHAHDRVFCFKFTNPNGRASGIPSLP